MPDEVHAIVVDLLRRATRARLRDDADELAQLIQELNAPLPASLPLDMLRLLGRERARSRRLLALLAGPDL